jgi:hypothetical protein
LLELSIGARWHSVPFAATTFFTACTECKDPCADDRLRFHHDRFVAAHVDCQSGTRPLLPWITLTKLRGASLWKSQGFLGFCSGVALSK